MTRRHRLLVPAVAGLVAVLAAGCTAVEGGAVQGGAVQGSNEVAATPTGSPAASAGSRRAAGEVGRAGPSPTAGASRAAGRAAAAAGQPSAAREPRRSYLSIPAIGLREIPVVRYPGRPDDAAGTRIQDRGPTASPRGRRGGVGPGEVGNFIITGHRTSHSAPFRDLPALRVDDLVRVRAGRTILVYRIEATRKTSFRSRTSRAEQVAAVPGDPGARPVRPMITLSTCATPEDRAAGNYWSDRFGNPEHRIDKVGVLVRRERVGA